jgi:hypothetical protein
MNDRAGNALRPYPGLRKPVCLLAQLFSTAFIPWIVRCATNPKLAGAFTIATLIAVLLVAVSRVSLAIDENRHPR